MCPWSASYEQKKYLVPIDNHSNYVCSCFLCFQYRKSYIFFLFFFKSQPFHFQFPNNTNVNIITVRVQWQQAVKSTALHNFLLNCVLLEHFINYSCWLKQGDWKREREERIALNLYIKQYPYIFIFSFLK